jgi:hypothetical protein
MKTIAHYTGQPLRLGSRERREEVLRVQERLIALNCGKVALTGVFDIATFTGVKTFQARYGDHFGDELTINGVVDRGTWDTIMGHKGEESPSLPQTTLRYYSLIVQLAVAEIGVTDSRKFVEAAGIEEGSPWGVAFMIYCCSKAGDALDTDQLAMRGASAKTIWERAKRDNRTISSLEATEGSRSIFPGMAFLTLIPDDCFGHAGIIESVVGNKVFTIEGGTMVGRFKERPGVYRRVRRISNLIPGFITFDANQPT